MLFFIKLRNFVPTKINCFTIYKITTDKNEILCKTLCSDSRAAGSVLTLFKVIIMTQIYLNNSL